MAGVDDTQIGVKQELAAAGGWLNSQAGHCADELHRLKTQLQPLVHSWYASQAADYYQGLQQEWDVAAEGLFGPDGVLGQIAQAMHVTWNNYAEAEWSNIQTWQR